MQPDVVPHAKSMARVVCAGLILLLVLLGSADAAVRTAPWLRGAGVVVPGRDVTFLMGNVRPQDLNWVRIQPRTCPSSYGCTATFAPITSHHVTTQGMQLTFRWPAGYVVCTSAPEGSGGFCSAIGHTWKNGEPATVLIGSFVFDEQACMNVHVRQQPGTPKQANPRDGTSGVDWYSTTRSACS